jgi:Secretion system C-terminal sorting domain
MKKTTLFFTALSVICLFSKISNAQSPNWLWAKSAGSGIDEQANSVAVDVSGNTYVVGWFDSDTIKFGTTALPNMGAHDIFIVKYNSSGIVQWARSAGGDWDDYANSVTADASGNIYIAGYFTSDTARFGSYTLLNSGGTDNTADMFLAKYDSNGNALWARNATGLGDDKAYGVSVDASGNAYVAGYFTSFYLTFGTTMLTNTDTTSYTDDIFIAKYNTSGNVVWAKSAGDIGWDEANAVAADASGNVYMAGIFDSPTINFGATTLINTDNSGNTYDIFLTKYNTNGTVQWAKSAGGASFDYALSVGLNTLGNIYVAGYFGSPEMYFGSDSLENYDSLGVTNDLFLAKYDTNGNEIWAKSAGGDGDDISTSVAVDATGNTFLTGYFNSPSVAFGSSILTNEDTNYYQDIFIAKYDASGNVLWAKSTGGSSDDEANSITIDATGNAYVAGGYYSPTMPFGTNTLINVDNTANTEDVFVAKLSNIVGINEMNYSENISVYPNPATNDLTIEVSQKSLIEIYNIEGRLIESTKTNNSFTKIDISWLSKGMYFLKASNDLGNAVVKFVKE